VIKLLDILKESAEPNIFYFAYGSNMEHERIKHRCPDAKKYSNGILHGWQRGVNREGVDTIIRDGKHSHVKGVVWKISKSDIDTLDKREGVDIGDYTEHYMSIETPHGTKKCLTYVAIDRKRGKPRPEYKQIVNKGKKENNIK